jgi:hypothetical protein
MIPKLDTFQSLQKNLSQFSANLAAFLMVSTLLSTQHVGAQAVDVTEATAVDDGGPPSKPGSKPVVGRKMAEKYMAPTAAAKKSGPTDHYMALHIGFYPTSAAYNWGGEPKFDDVGKFNAGLTYRLGEWVNSADLTLRIDFSRFDLGLERASKVSLLPVVFFPESSSRFPLYFGVGAGLGIYTSQLAGKSTVSLDYQILAGARFFEVFGQTGFFIEGGLKNHVHLLSEGQFNGVVLTAGTVFTF